MAFTASFTGRTALLSKIINEKIFEIDKKAKRWIIKK